MAKNSICNNWWTMYEQSSHTPLWGLPIFCIINAIRDIWRQIINNLRRQINWFVNCEPGPKLFSVQRFYWINFCACQRTLGISCNPNISWAITSYNTHKLCHAPPPPPLIIGLYGYNVCVISTTSFNEPNIDDNNYFTFITWPLFVYKIYWY